MLKKLICMGFVLVLLRFKNVDSQTTFAETFLMAGTPSSMTQTKQGGYIFTSMVAGGIVAVNLNSSGKILWSKKIQSPNYATVKSILPTQDGGFVLAGEIDQGEDANVLVLKMSSAGKILWKKAYGSPATLEWANSIAQLSDAGFVLTGPSWVNGTSPGLLIMKLDSSGKIVWKKVLEASEGTSIVPLLDGGFIVTAGTVCCEMIALRLDSLGNLVWKRMMQSDDFTTVQSVAVDAKGNFLLSGYANPGTDIGPPKLLLVKLSSNGAIVWRKAFTTNYFGAEVSSVVTTADENYLVAAVQATAPGQSSNILILKVGSSGSVMQKRTFGGGFSDYASFLIKTMDGGYAVLGGTWEGSAVIVLKLDSNATISGCSLFKSPGLPVIVPKLKNISRDVRTAIPSFATSIPPISVIAYSIQREVSCQ